MSDAKAKAEARRQAILARGTNRLAKLTSSARGEEYTASIYDDPPLPVPSSRESSPFVSSSRVETPSGLSSSLEPSASNTSQFDSPFGASPFGPGGPQLDPQDPMAALFAMMSGGDPSAAAGGSGLPPAFLQQMQAGSPFGAGGGGGAFGAPPTGASPFPPSPSQQAPETSARSRWLFTLLRIISTTSLVLYYIFYLEPQKYDTVDLHGLPATSRWERWSDLARIPNNSVNGIQKLPFLWTFFALQATIQTLQAFVSPQPAGIPMLLNLAMPFLPRPLTLLVTSGFSYLKIGTNLLDDVALSLFLVGFVVWISSR